MIASHPPRPSVVIAFTATTLLLVRAAGLLAAPENGPAEKVFVGYVHGTARDVRYDLYTHLCHAFIVANETGKLRPNERVPSRQLVAEAHAAGVEVLLSLGGWGWDKQFAAILANPAAEERYVQAVMRLVDDFDYDGIDLDWEYPDTADEAPGFERLARRLRAELDAIGKRKNRPLLLTMAASASPEKLRWLRPELLLETMDWINVMTYDYAGEWSALAEHHSPLFASSKASADGAYSTELTMKYLVEDRKLPADRLAVGLPLYGRGFAVGEPYAATTGVRPERRMGGNYARLHALQGKDGWQRQWDDETKSPWLVAPDGSSVIGYDDAESIALKTEWAMKQKFRGVFFWQIEGDRLPDGSHPLQESAHQVWKAGTPADPRR